jgi:hypothetical protein
LIFYGLLLVPSPVTSIQSYVGNASTGFGLWLLPATFNTRTLGARVTLLLLHLGLKSRVMARLLNRANDKSRLGRSSFCIPASGHGILPLCVAQYQGLSLELSNKAVEVYVDSFLICSCCRRSLVINSSAPFWVCPPIKLRLRLVSTEGLLSELYPSDNLDLRENTYMMSSYILVYS